MITKVLNTLFKYIESHNIVHTIQAQHLSILLTLIRNYHNNILHTFKILSAVNIYYLFFVYKSQKHHNKNTQYWPISN